MFGLSGNMEEKIAKLVDKKAWDKIQEKYLHSEEATQIILARACSKSDCDDSRNTLLALLDLPAESVKMAALESLSIVGNDHVTSTLQLMVSKIPQDNAALKEKAMKTLQDVRAKRKH